MCFYLVLSLLLQLRDLEVALLALGLKNQFPIPLGISSHGLLLAFDATVKRAQKSCSEINIAIWRMSFISLSGLILAISAFYNNRKQLVQSSSYLFNVTRSVRTVLFSLLLADTSFMYMIAGLCMLKLYQTRHPDINASAYSAYASFAVVICLAVLGVVGLCFMHWCYCTQSHGQGRQNF